MLGLVMSIIVQLLCMFCSIVQVLDFGRWSDWIIGLIALNVVLCFCTWLSWREYKNE